MGFLKSTIVQNSDPLARLVRDKLQWSPKQFGIAVLIANMAIDFPAAWYFRAFVTQSGHPGLFQDPSALFVNYVMMPIVGGFYIWTISGIAPLLQELRASNVFMDETSFDRTVQELTRRLRSRSALAVSVSASVIVTLLLVGTFLDWYPWPRGLGYLNHSDILPWLRTPMWFLTTYALGFALFNIAVTVLSLRRMFQNQSIRISPWHPDRCGGLRSISQYSLTLGYPIAVIGAMLSIITVQEISGGTFIGSYLSWIAITLYVLLAPLTFFLPLGTAHTAMHRAKDSSLSLLAKQFDNEYSKIEESCTEADVLEDRVKKIEQLRKLYEITLDFPVWPFDMTNLRRFLAIISAPVIPGIFSLVLDLLKSLLGI